VGIFSNFVLRSGSEEVRKSWNSSDMKIKASLTQLLRKYDRYLTLSLTTFSELLPEALLAGRQGTTTPGHLWTKTSRSAANSLYLL